VDTYTRTWIDGFLDGETADDDLWEWLREEFNGWTREAFERINPTLRKKFKAGLRQNGVYIGGEGTVSEQLVRALRETRQAR
jgi:hypothetical protein